MATSDPRPLETGVRKRSALWPAGRRWMVLLCLPLLGGCLIERVEDRGRFNEAVPTCEGDAALADRLRGHVVHLAQDIGARSFLEPEALKAAADYVHAQLADAGGGTVVEQEYRIAEAWQHDIRARAWERHQRCLAEWKTAWRDLQRSDSPPFRNIELVLPGSSASGTVVVGAHYDSDACESQNGNPGADDNASGVAALIELARRLAGRPLARTVRLVAFTNEEEPFFHTRAMGSRRYARHLRESGVAGDVQMLSLETVGYYPDEPDSQIYPPLVRDWLDLPSVGNFLAFVGNRASKPLVRQALCGFQQRVAFPAEGWVASASVPGVDWSDHWSFWEEGVPAVMVTDTAPNRNRCYHAACDVPARLDYDRLARVVIGLTGVVESLAADPPPPCDLATPHIIACTPAPGQG